MKTSLSNKSPVAGRRIVRDNTITLYNDTVKRIEESKKKKNKKPSKPVSITLTPDAALEESTILLSTSAHSPIHGSPVTPKKLSNTISFANQIEIFEIPRLDDDEEE